MKVHADRFYINFFIILLLLQLYLPSFKVNMFIQIAALAFLACLQQIIVSKKFIRQLIPVILLFVIGFIGTLLHRYHLYNFIKDIFHFLKPITGIALGYIIFKKVNNLEKFMKAVVTAGLISAVIHFLILIFLIRSTSSIEDIREFTKDNFLELFSIFFIVYYKKFAGEHMYRSKLYTRLIIAVLLFSCVLYFSRTMIVMGGILVLSVNGLTKITARTLKALSILTVCTLLFYTYLYNNASITRDKAGLEGFLFKIKNAPEEILNTNIDRENHADLWDHWRAYEAKRAIALMNESPSSYIFGTGHGSLVNLKFFAPLTGEPKGIRYISELHNGYIYVLYKTGIVGLLIYLSLLIRWYRFIYTRKGIITVLISGIGVIYLFSTITITGLYNGRDIIIFILGALLHFVTYQPEVNLLTPSVHEH
jgi:hypothetical protein